MEDEEFYNGCARWVWAMELGEGGLASAAELVPVPLGDAQSRQVRKAQPGKKLRQGSGR